MAGPEEERLPCPYLTCRSDLEPILENPWGWAAHQHPLYLFFCPQPPLSEDCPLLLGTCRHWQECPAEVEGSLSRPLLDDAVTTKLRIRLTMVAPPGATMQ